MPKAGLAALLGVATLAAGCGSSGSSPPPQTTTTAGTPTPRSKVTRIGSLPRAVSKAAAVALPNGRLMILGGYTGAGALDTILAGPPNHLRVVGSLPQPTHDAAAAAVGGSVYLFGGGESVSMPSVVRIDPRTGSAAEAPALGEPLSDLGAVVASTVGKIELESVGDEAPEERVVERLITKALFTTFGRRVDLDDLDDVVLSFEDGLVVETGERVPSREYVRWMA